MKRMRHGLQASVPSLLALVVATGAASTPDGDVGAGGTAPLATAATPGCPVHVYLGNNPDGTDWPDWSENAQGIANDGHHWYFTRKNGLFKYDANWQPIVGSDTPRLASVPIPAKLAAIGIDHYGDPDYYAGYVFVPFEGDNRALIAAFRASDLVLVDWVSVFAFQPKAGWAAIDPVERVLYTSDDHIVAGTPLQRYAVDVGKIENGIRGDFLARVTPKTVLDVDGSPVSGEYGYMQGGVFTPWGDLYLAVGKADDSPEDTRGGLHLFRRTPDGTAFQLVESSVNESNHVGEAVFAFEYHPDFLGFGEEPEGIDWWNRDNAPDSPYKGQLHAILLDNQIYDDQIWLKHYRVDYVCAGDDDSDGDGVADRDEAYVHNTHPLLSDSDGDGQSDGHELACGSNPLDPSSAAGDFDGDAIPDCVDTDDDDDGVADEADRCAETLIPDPVIPTSGVLRVNRYALLDDDLAFDGGKAAPAFTTISTGGCNATQIADALGLGVSHYEYGITGSVLERWIAGVP